MIYERLILMRDLMHEDGSIYLHCAWRVNAAASAASERSPVIQRRDPVEKERLVA